MPSGRTHDRITWWSFPILAGFTFWKTQSSSLTLLISVGFLFGGLMFGPDLDIHSVQYKRWGWFRWIWIPYRGSMRHRSVLSHGPIVGTTLRIIYLSLWLGILGLFGLTIVNELWQTGLTWERIAEGTQRSLQQHTKSWLVLCLGLELGALSHYTSDWGSTTYKHCKKQGWQGLLLPKSKPKRKSASIRRGKSPSQKIPKRQIKSKR